jgi:hypothetical protein
MNEKDFVITAGVLIKYKGEEKNVIIPYGVTGIGISAFEDCSIESVVIPSSVTEIRMQAFLGCISLTKVVIPDSVTYLGEAAFYDCKSLAEVIMSKNIKTIETETFAYSPSLKYIEIPEGVDSIESSAFYECISLESITIPSSITSIATKTFGRCESLSKVVFKGDFKVGFDIFKYSDNIKEIRVPSEKVKTNLYVTGNISEGCNVLVDKPLNKENSDVTLGSIFISSSCNPIASYNSTIEKSSILPISYEVDDSDELI